MPLTFTDGSIENQGTYIEVAWKHGRLQRLSAPFLRAVCQCAQCASLPMKIEAKMFPGLKITRLEAVGGYAFQCTFSDGHFDGAYGYDMLQRLPDDM
jgi:DUF971 family protein